MRVLFSTTPGWGHVHPMVPLAQAFRDRGDDVAWAAAPEVTPRLHDMGFSAFAAGLGANEAFAAVRTEFPEILEITHSSTRRGFPLLFGAVRVGPMLADLAPIADSWEPSLIVHEQGELAGPLVAAAARIPSVTHSFGQLLRPENLDPAELGVAPFWQARGLDVPPYAGCYAQTYLDIFPPSLQSSDYRHLSRVQPIRPVTFASGAEEPLPEWIAGGTAPLVYVTFGTVFNENVEVIRTVVEAVRALPVRVVVTVGPGADPSMLGEQPDNVLVAPYIPQTQLLSHCAVVVSHAGSGTYLAALARGLPQVCIPQGADQFDNASSCAAGGVGQVVMPEELSVETVRSRTEEVMSDLSFRRAAEWVQKEIADMPSPAAVADLIASSVVGS